MNKLFSAAAGFAAGKRARMVLRAVVALAAFAALAASAGCGSFSGVGAAVSDMNAGPWCCPDEAKPKASVSVWLSFGF